MSKNPHIQTKSKTTGDRTESVLFAGFLLLAMATPLVDMPSYFDSILVKDALFFLGTGVLFMAWLLLKKGRSVFVDAQLALIVIFLGLIFVSTAGSIHLPTSLFGQYRTWGGAASFIIFALTYFLAIQVSWDKQRIKTLMRAMVYTAGVIAAVKVVQFSYALAFSGAVRAANTVTASFVGYNVFSFYLMLMWPLALRLLLSPEVKRREKTALAAASLFIFVGNIITLSRTGWILSLVLFLAVVFMAGNKKKLLGFAAIFAVFILSIALITANQADRRVNLVQRATSIFTTGSMTPRVEIWKLAVKLIERRPLTGFGPDTFRVAFTRVESIGYAQLGSKFRTPHNYPLNVAVGAGIPALLILAIIFSRAIIKAFSGRDYWRQSLGLSLVSAVISSQTLEWHTFLIFPFWLFMGIVYADVRTRKNLSTVFKPALLILAALVIVWAGSIAAADFYSERGRRLPASSLKTAYLRKAVWLNPYAYIYWQRYFKSQARRPLAERLEIIKRSRRFHPLQEETWIAEADLMRKNKAPSGQVGALVDKALEIRPYSVEAHFLKGRVLRNRKLFQEAWQEFDLVIMLSPHQPEYIKAAVSAKNHSRSRVRAQ